MMQRRMRLVVGLLTFACGGGAVPGRDSGASDSPRATGTDTTATTARFDGVGALRVGTSIRETVAALGGTVDTTQDPMPGSACNYVRFSALPLGTLVMVWGDTVMRVDVDSATVRTQWGTGVGSTVAEIRQRHPSHEVRQEPHPYSAPYWHYMVVDPRGDTTHRIIFETDSQQVARSYRVGFRRAVDLIEGCS